jgi:hypothetical protein
MISLGKFVYCLTALVYAAFQMQIERLIRLHRSSCIRDQSNPVSTGREEKSLRLWQQYGSHVKQMRQDAHAATSGGRVSAKTSS